MSIYTVLESCTLYRSGHPTSQVWARQIVMRIESAYGVLPIAGCAAQIKYPKPTSCWCLDHIARKSPSVTVSLSGRPEQYRGLGLARVFVPPRPGCVRLRVRSWSGFRLVVPALVRAGELAGLKRAEGRRRAAGSAGQRGAEPTPPTQNPPQENEETGRTTVPANSPTQEATPTTTPDPFFGTDEERKRLEETAQGGICNGCRTTSKGGHADGQGIPHPSSQLPEEVRVKLGAIAMLIQSGTPESMLHAAVIIRGLDAAAGADGPLRDCVQESITMWRHARLLMKKDAVDAFETCLPQDPRIVNATGLPIRSSRSRGWPSDRTPIPPPAEIDRWMEKYLSTEDQLRELCIYLPTTASDNQMQVQPLTRFRDGPIWGRCIAPLYREHRIHRPWDPERAPEAAIVHDFILVVALKNKGIWTPHVSKKMVPRLLPYVRSMTLPALLGAAATGICALETSGLVQSCGPRTWRMTKEGMAAIDTFIAPIWARACGI